MQMIGIIKNEDDVQVIQKDIDELQLWAKNWQMSLIMKNVK